MTGQTLGTSKPLYDEQIERSVLGCCISSLNMLDTAIDFIGGKQVFYIEKHIYAWEAILAVKSDERSVDMLTVSQKIRAMQKSNLVSPFDLMQMVQDITGESERNLVSHLLLLVEYWVKREIANISLDYQLKATQEDTDALEILHNLRVSVKDIEDSIGRAKIVDIAKNTEKVVKDILTVAYSGKKPKGLVPTGFKELDELYGGSNEGDFIVIGARPAMGKTSFAMCWAKNIANSGLPVGFISIEMPTEQLVTRLLSIESGIDNDRLQKQAYLMTKDELDRLEVAGKRVGMMPIKIVDDPSVNSTKMRVLVKTFKELGAKMVFIDYLQIMRPEGKAQSANDTKFLDDLTRDLKGAAREFQIPIVALSQLSRGVEDSSDKRPTLNHLRMSGQIEANADAVMFLYRPEYYRLDMPNDLGGGNSFNKAVVIIAKNRNGGVGDVVLDFIKQNTEFRGVGDRSWVDKIPSNNYYEPSSDDDAPF
jgi:replicative DNA helicase